MYIEFYYVFMNDKSGTAEAIVCRRQLHKRGREKFHLANDAFVCPDAGEPSHATRREYIKSSGERGQSAVALFCSSRQRAQYVRKELRAGPGGPRPVLLPPTDQLTIPPIFRIEDRDLHTGRKPQQRRNSQTGFHQRAVSDLN